MSATPERCRSNSRRTAITSRCSTATPRRPPGWGSRPCRPCGTSSGHARRWAMALDGNGAGARGLGVGLIGLGEVGQHHLVAYQTSARATLVAVADLAEELTTDAASRTGARAYGDFRDLLADPTLQAVDVSLPHHLHLPVVLEALGRGLDVLVEKPMGLTVAECDQMIAAAQAAGRTLAVSHNQVFFAPHIEAIDLVEAGAIGR